MVNQIPGITIWRFKSTTAKAHIHRTCSKPNPFYWNNFLTIHMKIFSAIFLHWDSMCWFNHSSMKTRFWAYKIWNVKETEQEKNNQQLLCFDSFKLNKLHLSFFFFLHLSQSVWENDTYIYTGNNSSFHVISTGIWQTLSGQWWE